MYLITDALLAISWIFLNSCKAFGLVRGIEPLDCALTLFTVCFHFYIFKEALGTNFTDLTKTNSLSKCSMMEAYGLPLYGSENVNIFCRYLMTKNQLKQETYFWKQPFSWTKSATLQNLQLDNQAWSEQHANVKNTNSTTVSWKECRMNQT